MINYILTKTLQSIENNCTGSNYKITDQEIILISQIIHNSFKTN
jgi:hypothetical protein